MALDSSLVISTRNKLVTNAYGGTDLLICISPEKYTRHQGRNTDYHAIPSCAVGDMPLIQGEFFREDVEMEISPRLSSVGGGDVGEDVVRANLSLLDVQKSDHARDEGELDGGGDEEDCEGDVEELLSEHFLFSSPFLVYS